jgi:hypothetical protein
LRFFNLKSGELIERDSFVVIDGLMRWNPAKTLFENIIPLDFAPDLSTVPIEDFLSEAPDDDPIPDDINEDALSVLFDDDPDSSETYSPMNGDDDSDLSHTQHDTDLDDSSNSQHGYNLRSRRSTTSLTSFDSPMIHNLKLFVIDGVVKIPRAYREAVSGSQAQQWKSAIRSEYEALLKSRTFDIVDIPPGRNLIGCRRVFDLKYSLNGDISRFKARLVAQGFTQVPGVDYHDTYSPVVNMASVRTLIALAVIYGWKIRQLDIKTAYLNAPLQESLFMRAVPGFTLPDGKCLRLLQSLYGLKQSGKNWNTLLNEFLTSLGLTATSSDPCVFFKRKKDGKILLLCVYVDDIIITGDDELGW